MCLCGQPFDWLLLDQVPIPVWPVVSCRIEQVCPRLPAPPGPVRGGAGWLGARTVQVQT